MHSTNNGDKKASNSSASEQFASSFIKTETIVGEYLLDLTTEENLQ